jgi:hypothetical protein
MIQDIYDDSFIIELVIDKKLSSAEIINTNSS